MKYLAKQWNLGLIRQAGCTRNLFLCDKALQKEDEHQAHEPNSKGGRDPRNKDRNSNYRYFNA